MMSRFSLLKPVTNLLGLFAAVSILNSMAFAQQDSAGAKPGFALPEKPLKVEAGKFTSDRRKGAAAYLRVVYLLPDEAGPLQLVVKPAAGEKSEIHFTGPFLNLIYQPIGLGTTTLKLSRENDAEKVIAEAQAIFAPNAYATLWIVPKDGTLAYYLTDDNYDRKAPVNRLIVYNYFPGATISLTSVREGAGGPPSAENILPIVQHRGLKYGEAQGFDRLAVTKDLYLWIDAALANGRNQSSLRTLTFGNITRYSLVFKPDSYGDLESVILFDGPPLNAETMFEVAPPEETPASGTPAK